MNKPIKLICLPYAGGSRYSFRGFQKTLSPLIELIGLEYPGRGARFRESLVSNLDGLVDDMFLKIAMLANDSNYAIYGHSMGGLVGWLLAKKISLSAMPAPGHLFISGTAGPASRTGEKKKRHLLPKKQFLEEIHALAGSPDEVMNNAGLIDYYEPILRSDFKACECYNHQQSPPLHIPFTVITGTEEELTEDDIMIWQQETTVDINFIRLKGNHFFIIDQYEAMTAIINQQLLASFYSRPEA